MPQMWVSLGFTCRNSLPEVRNRIGGPLFATKRVTKKIAESGFFLLEPFDFAYSCRSPARSVTVRA